jgi:pimeloyl-ACP methyl ester carboxylesterase
MTGTAGPTETDGGRAPAPGSAWWADLGGPVHFVDHGGPADGPLLVLVHGLGGSLLNWAAVAPELARTGRVLALDLAGFGRTRGSGERSTSVHENQLLLHRFLTEVAGEPVVLVGNSMGGLITVLQAAEHPETVAAAVLIDPALPVGPRVWPHPLVGALFTAYALPAVGRAVLGGQRRLVSPEATALALLRLCCVDPSRVHPEVVAEHVGLARERHGYPDTDAELLVAARSLLWVLARRRRYAMLMRAIQVPVLLLHGEKDRLVPLAAAAEVAARNPGWRFAVARDVGHVPQLEAPEWTVAQIRDWFATAADRTRRR